MKLIKKKSNKKGFTLVELVIVIAILAILALILVPAVAKYIGNADTAKNEAAVRTIYTNAVLVNSETDRTDKIVEIGKISNTATTDFAVYLDKATKAVVKVVYTAEPKVIFVFDGKEMNGPLETAPELEGTEELLVDVAKP